MQKKPNKIIGIFARPEDIALTFSGTLLKQKQNKANTKAVVLTSSEIESEKSEVYKASEIIGINEVNFLKYKSGMLKESGLDNAKNDIFDFLMQVRPNIVICPSLHGYSQNPDAKGTALASILAYEKYFEVSQNPSKLFFYVLPEEFFKFASTKGFYRKDFQGFNFESTPDKKITHVVDFKKYKNKKILALKAFKSKSYETSRAIELLKTYKSALMDYFILGEVDGEKVFFEEFSKIASRL